MASFSGVCTFHKDGHSLTKWIMHEMFETGALCKELPFELDIRNVVETITPCSMTCKRRKTRVSLKLIARWRKEVATHVSHPGHKQQVLLMTCRVRVIGNDGTTCEARVLLDPALTVSLITEKLAQSLHLPRQCSTTRVSGVGGGPATVLA